MDVKIEESWKEVLKKEFSQPYFQQIALHLKTERAQKKIIYQTANHHSQHYSYDTGNQCTATTNLFCK